MLMLPKNKNEAGFTLVELLTVIAIFGMLIIIVVPTLTGQLNRSQGNKVKEVLQQALSVSDGYFQENGSYDGFDTVIPNTDVPEWPTEKASEITWTVDPIWDPVNDVDAQGKTVYVNVVSGDELGLAMYTTHGNFYCVKIDADVVTYNVIKATALGTCIDDATDNKNWPSDP